MKFSFRKTHALVLLQNQTSFSLILPLHYFLSPPSPPLPSQLLPPVCFPSLLRACSHLAPHLLHLPHSATARAGSAHRGGKKRRRTRTRRDSCATCLPFTRGTRRCFSPPTRSRSCFSLGDFLLTREELLHREVVALAAVGVQAGGGDQSAGAAMRCLGYRCVGGARTR